MGAITGALERVLPLEGPYPLTAARLVEALAGRASATGRAVNADSALGIAAVYSSVRVITDAVSSLPLFVYRRLQPRGREHATGHPLYDLLHGAANPYMTTMQFRETLQGHMLLWGNAFANIERDGAGRIVALWPLRPQDVVRIERSQAGTLLYIYRVPSRAAVPLSTSIDMSGGEPGTTVAIPQRDMFHIRGFSPDGVRG